MLFTSTGMHPQTGTVSRCFRHSNLNPNRSLHVHDGFRQIAPARPGLFLTEVPDRCAWTNDEPIVLFAVADISPDADIGSTMQISLENYKDITLREGIIPDYWNFPIVSDYILCGGVTRKPIFARRLRTSIFCRNGFPVYIR